jgi:hypothetical protein
MSWARCEWQRGQLFKHKNGTWGYRYRDYASGRRPQRTGFPTKGRRTRPPKTPQLLIRRKSPGRGRDGRVARLTDVVCTPLRRKRQPLAVPTWNLLWLGATDRQEGGTLRDALPRARRRAAAPRRTPLQSFDDTGCERHSQRGAGWGLGFPPSAKSSEERRYSQWAPQRAAPRCTDDAGLKTLSPPARPP